ncbi:MAG: c-type cytochrome [Gemmatales bacterium]|nr:c-type cytochrome [Gemmatales bacterium]MDW7994604.1 c-type cytochrome [Gemmatales bacterium]
MSSYHRILAASFGEFTVPAKQLNLAWQMCGAVTAVWLTWAGAWCNKPTKPDKPIGPLSPREALATFALVPGFRIELVAAEPDVIDPVAMTFDEDGRLFVVEMPGYPNEGVAIGQPRVAGRVRQLEDCDGDGYYETSRIFADDLRFPTGITVWRGGLIVANAPDLIYCRDTNRDGRADFRSVLYTGFGIRNIQQLVNSLQFHFDNWIYGCNAASDSEVRPVQDCTGKLVLSKSVIAIGARHFRLRPDEPGKLEPTSGGGQYGLSCDDYGQWFTCTNSQHIRHIVLPDVYLRRNPYLRTTTVVVDIPDGTDEHTSAARVYRISPFEPWRLERTQMRREGPDASRFAKTELVPGGYVTSACGILVERGGRFSSPHAGLVYVCDPANNVIHRDVLVPHGVTFIAKRLDKDCEFLASTDTWFRPVFLCQGPDGALYVADFYREVIETPLSLPEEIKRRYNLESRGRGRIWRIAPADGQRPPCPQLSRAKNEELVRYLEHANAWYRLTAQRLLIERRPGPELRELLLHVARQSKRDIARIHALWTLAGLEQLHIEDVCEALCDHSPRVREQALVLAEPFLKQGEPTVIRSILKLAHDPDERVRFQLAFALGYVSATQVSDTLLTLLRRDGNNRWMQMAILSSALPHAAHLLDGLSKESKVPQDVIVSLAGMVAAQHDTEALARLVLKRFGEVQAGRLEQYQLAVALAQGLARQGQSLANLLPTDSAARRTWMQLLHSARQAVGQTDNLLAERLAAIRLLAYDEPASVIPILTGLLEASQPAEIQIASLRSLAQLPSPQVAAIVLRQWPGFSPQVRRVAQETLFTRPDRLTALLDAIEKGDFRPQDLDLVYRQQLLQHPNTELRSRAQRLLRSFANEDRARVINEYRTALQLRGNVERGRELFVKHCAICHRIGQTGAEVGPDLLATLKTKTAEGLMIDILDPSREVDNRYLNYLVLDRSGRVYTGIIIAETATAITLRRAEGAEDTLLRSEIEQIQATGKSLMPDGFEKQFTPQDLADLLAWLQTLAR